MARPSKKQSRVLLVEGPDDKEVIFQFCNRHAIDNRSLFDVEVCGGFTELRDTLSQEPRFGREAVWAIVDADADCLDRWRSLHGVLEGLGYTDVPLSPARSGTILPAKDSLARLGVWLMPDNESAGILEDFLARLVSSEDVLLPRANAAVDAIPAHERRFAEVRRPKALMHTWLAWQEEPGTPLGLAVTRRYLQTDHELAERFLAWLRLLFESQ